MQRGISLSETLIALVVIGIIASITLPNTIARFKNYRNGIVLKTDYAILGNVLRRAHSEGAIADLTRPDNRADIINLFETHFLPNMQVTSTCYDTDGCWSSNVKTLNGRIGDSSQTSKNCGLGSISFTMYNGSTICIDDFFGSTTSNLFGVNTPKSLNLIFYIDVNGINRPPNVFGKDIFIIVFNNNERGEFLPAGYSKDSNAVKQDCSAKGTGRWCMKLVLDNNFQIPFIK